MAHSRDSFIRHCWEIWLGQLPENSVTVIGFITDVKLDGERAYGPQSTRDLAKKNPVQAKYNAENYMWWLIVSTYYDKQKTK